MAGRRNAKRNSSKPKQNVAKRARNAEQVVENREPAAEQQPAVALQQNASQEVELSRPVRAARRAPVEAAVASVAPRRSRRVSKRKIDAEVAEGDEPAVEQAPAEAPAEAPGEAPAEAPAQQEVPQVARPVPSRQSLRVAARQPFPFDITYPDLQEAIIRHVYDDADIYKQITMRELGRLWRDEARRRFNNVAALVVTLKNAETDRCQSIFAANETLVRSQLHFNEMERANLVTEMRELEHREIEVTRKHWNSVTFESIGQLFGHVRHLVILHDTRHMLDIEMYQKLLARFRVDTFSLIIQHSVTDQRFLSQIIRVVRDRLAPLRQLHLCFVLDNQINAGRFHRLRTTEYESTLRSLEKFSMHCVVRNQEEVIQSVGRGIEGEQRPVPLQALSMLATISTAYQLEDMLEHNAALGQITRLQLLEIRNFYHLRNHLDIFPQLESLQLWASQEIRGHIMYFGEYQALARLAHLTDLSLFGLGILYLERLLEHEERADNIRRLRVVTHNFINKYIKSRFNGHHKINAILHDEQMFNRIDAAFVIPVFANMARLFPNLEQLTIEADLRAIRRFDDELVGMVHGLFDHLPLDNIRLIHKL